MSTYIGFFSKLTAARGPYYEAVGCFNDKPKPNRAMPDLIGYFRHDIDWTDLSKMVKKCAVTAKEKGKLLRL